MASAPLTVSVFTDLVLSAFLLLDTCENFNKVSTRITLSLPPLNVLHCNPAILNGGLVSRIRGSSKQLDHLLKRTQEQLDLNPFEGTQSLVMLKLEVNDKQFVERMRFDDPYETGIIVMVE
ncbi:hypothetical protein Tco_0992859 [Tanacetum coccineum]|uniref:Uncharacterized protein n=1 Tax=Tanacetum coccineum TaxID=301880 RepID=A0ABQ5F3J3_9ASTR